MIHLSVNYSLGYWRSFLAKTWLLARSNCMGPFLQHTPVFLLVWWRTSPATRHKQSSFCLPLYPQPLVQSIYFSFLTFQLLLNVLVWSCVVESQRCYSSATHRSGVLHKYKQLENQPLLQNPERLQKSHSGRWYRMGVRYNCQNWEPVAVFLLQNPTACILRHLVWPPCSSEPNRPDELSSRGRQLISSKQL